LVLRENRTWINDGGNTIWTLTVISQLSTPIGMPP